MRRGEPAKRVGGGEHENKESAAAKNLGKKIVHNKLWREVENELLDK